MSSQEEKEESVEVKGKILRRLEKTKEEKRQERRTLLHQVTTKVTTLAYQERRLKEIYS